MVVRHNCYIAYINNTHEYIFKTIILLKYCYISNFTGSCGKVTNKLAEAILFDAITRDGQRLVVRTRQWLCGPRTTQGKTNDRAR